MLHTLSPHPHIIVSPHTPPARHYNSDLSIWLSVDPMSDKYPSTSPYTYCGNNPVKLVDPDGREIGNYYDICGNYLGTDGNDDGEVYILTSAHDIDLAESNHIRGFHTDVGEFNSPMRLPFAETRKEIVDGLIQQDAENCFAEAGCIYGFDPQNNKEVVRWAERGKTVDPRTNSIAPIDYNTVNRKNFIPYATAHGHPSGWISSSHFVQEPSPTDYENAAYNATLYSQMNRPSIVVGMGNCQIYIYDAYGNRASMPIDQFLNLR